MVSDYRTIYLSDAYRPETFDIHIISVYVCAPAGTRTRDPRIKSALLCQLSYERIILFVNQYVKELNT